MVINPLMFQSAIQGWLSLELTKFETNYVTLLGQSIKIIFVNNKLLLTYNHFMLFNEYVK